ncbi:Lipopolysaccharide-assembly, LptC-related [compost metagenome]
MTVSVRLRNAFLVAATGLAMMGSVWGLFQLMRPRSLPEPPPPRPAVQLETVELVEYDGGQKLWELFAENVVYDRDRQLAELEELEVRFWEDGQVVSIARSPRAILETAARNIRMQGGIRVTSTQATTSVEAREVEWQAGTQELHAIGDVVFRRGPSTVEGPELWANRSLMRARVGSPVKARVVVDLGAK